MRLRGLLPIAVGLLCACAKKPAPTPHVFQAPDIAADAPALGKAERPMTGWGRAGEKKPAPRVLYFAYDSYRLKDTAAAAELAAYLRKTGRAARLEGHTCPLGDAAYNTALSYHRAEALRSYLVAAGVMGGRLEAVGYGEDRLATEDTTLYHLNRRVEVYLQ